jgi:hypothetical protein
MKFPGLSEIEVEKKLFVASSKQREDGRGKLLGNIGTLYTKLYRSTSQNDVL